MLLNTRSHRIRAIADLMNECSYGGVVTYQEMSVVSGVDVLEKRDLIRRARDISNRESGSLFAPDRGIGLRRLHANDTPSEAVKARRQIKRKADRTISHMQHSVRYSNSMSSAAVAETISHMNVLGTISASSVFKKKKITDLLDDSTEPQPTSPEVIMNAVMKHMASRG